MKKLILTIAIAVTGMVSQAQTKPFTSNVVLHNRVYESAHKNKDKSADQATGEFFKDAKGGLWPVYKSASGKLYALRTSTKTGKTYKQYLNTSAQ